MELCMDLDSHGARHLNDALLVVVRPGHVGDVASEKSLEYIIAYQNIMLPTVSPAHLDIWSAWVCHAAPKPKPTAPCRARTCDPLAAKKSENHDLTGNWMKFRDDNRFL